MKGNTNKPRFGPVVLEQPVKILQLSDIFFFQLEQAANSAVEVLIKKTQAIQESRSGRRET